MRRKILLSVLLVFGAVAPSWAQLATQVPKKCDAFRPDPLYSSMLTDKEARKLASSKDFYQKSSKRGENGKEFWIVYSDRKDNPAYDAPGSKKVINHLRFNQKVRIAQIVLKPIPQSNDKENKK